jgi:tRNA-dihydrouridine synthase A
MLDWTDRYCRLFHRQLSCRARLYTEMITANALLYGDRDRLLEFDEAEHPVALQLGGSEPHDLAQCARLAQRRGYDEINLNCGCPSERVQRGAFGACLMAEPDLVARCVDAMRQAASLPVTVKHRIGIDRIDSYDFVAQFVGTVHRAGCTVFIVHARSAWLKGLSPKENREIPPLRYDIVGRLKREFPTASFVLNGGIEGLDCALALLEEFDGVMLGRSAYREPYLLADVDTRVFDENRPAAAREQVVMAMNGRVNAWSSKGIAPWPAVRHMLGLYAGQPGARLWRRLLSDAAFQKQHGPDVLAAALHAVQSSKPGYRPLQSAA